MGHELGFPFLFFFFFFPYFLPLITTTKIQVKKNQNSAILSYRFQHDILHNFHKFILHSVLIQGYVWCCHSDSVCSPVECCLNKNILITSKRQLDNILPFNQGDWVVAIVNGRITKVDITKSKSPTLPSVSQSV